MQWRLILEEFGPDIRHIAGEDNIVADAISRLPTANEDQNEYGTDTRGLSSKVLAETEMLVLDDDNDIAFPLDLSLVERHNKLSSTKETAN